jgi:hypothetical protein
MPLLKIEDFCEKYEMNHSTLRTMRSERKIPPSAFVKDTKTLYVQEEFFVRRINFFKKCAAIAQSCCFLLEDHFSSSEISREILKHNNVSPTKPKTNSMNDFLRHGLFNTYTGIETIRTNKLLWQTARYAWAIERRLKKRGASIQKVLDNRHYED